MKNYPVLLILVVSLVVSLLALPAHAVEIAVTETLVFDIELSEGWAAHVEPPEALVKENASHVAHEPAAANATASQIEEVARKRLKVNEAFVYHAASGAHLDIDFSALDPGQSAPSARTLRTSAEYAAQSLESEDDVAEVVWEVTSAKINGVEETFMLSADYLQHGQPMTFRGYIGYIDNYWFFLYLTAPGKNPAALQDMQLMLESASIRSTAR
jgi:hypothetical protein